MNQENISKCKSAKLLAFIAILMTMTILMQTIVFANEGGTVLTVDTSLNVQTNQQDSQSGQNAGTGSVGSHLHGDTSESKEAPWVWYPISVINEPMNGFNAVRKTFALPPDVNPAVISTDDIEMFGQRFTFAYVLQQPTMSESFKEMRETVTIETRTRGIDEILSNLEQEIWFDRDGFAGTLHLDIHSISSAVAGTTRNTTTATRQRTFPHLSNPDNSFIPRTITDGGTTFYLTNVDWQPSGVSAVDGHPVSSSYTAHATYLAQVTQTRTTGYITTAEFVGTVFRTTPGMTLFTAVFYGEPIVEIWLDEANLSNTGDAKNDDSNTSSSSQNPSGYATSSNGADRVGELQSNSNPFLAIVGAVVGFGVLGFLGFVLLRRFKENDRKTEDKARGGTKHSVTIYSINSPRDIVRAGKIKIDTSSHEPTIVLNETTSKTPAKTERYIIQIAQKVAEKLIGKDLRIVLRDKEAYHQVPEKALDVPVYEFEVNFADEDYGDSEDYAGEAGMGSRR